jgi:hypothetical protein
LGKGRVSSYLNCRQQHALLVGLIIIYKYYVKRQLLQNCECCCIDIVSNYYVLRKFYSARTHTHAHTRTHTHACTHTLFKSKFSSPHMWY